MTIFKGKVEFSRKYNKGSYAEVKGINSAEPEGGIGTDGNAGKEAKKTKKMDFTKQMENITSSLQTLHNALLDRNTQLAIKMLQEDVATKFSKIAELVRFKPRPNYVRNDITDEYKEELESKEEEDGSEDKDVNKNKNKEN